MLAVPQAFASIDGPPNIDAVIVNPTSIDVYCTDPIVSSGTTVTGNVLEIYDDTYDGLGVDIDLSESDLTCSFGTLNKISTLSLVDLSTYSVRLTVSTSDGDVFYDDDGWDFVQPNSNAAILVLKELTSEGPLTIKFRDISVTNIGDPSITVPTLYPPKTGTFTIKDHNANANLASKEIIMAQVNGINVPVTETGVNTGIFTKIFTAGATVLYDPGTRGLARATININFEIDPENGLGLVGFSFNEKYDDLFGDGVYTPTETVYRDLDNSDTVSIGDVRLANAGTYGYIDGSVVVAFDADESIALVAFAADEKHDDSGSTSVFDRTETIYADLDASDTVTLGDIRLGNISIGGYFDGSIVADDAFDGKADIIIEDIPTDATPCALGPFSHVSHPVNIVFAHGGKASSNIGVTMSYADLVSVDPSTDPLLLQMYYQEPGLGYGLVTTLSDLNSNNANAKTIVSNPSFSISLGQLYNDNVNGDGTGLPLPMVQGSYVLGFDNGCGGGGGGGISKGGFLQAIGGLALFSGGSSIGSGGPPSFDSSFLVKQNDQILSLDAESKLKPSLFEIGTDSSIVVGFSLPGGLVNLDHVGIYANIAQGQTKNDSDTYIYFDKYKTPQVTIHDPHGFFKSANLSVIEKEQIKMESVLDFNFAKAIPKSSVIIEVWNNARESAQREIPNLIIVNESKIPEVKPDVNIVPVKEQPKPQVPTWIKNNAGWWGNNQINDNTFTSGIGYLIQNKIINVPQITSVNVSPDPTKTIQKEEFEQITPTWVKNNALWWSENKLTDDEFLNGIKYLLENGIIRVKV